MANTTTSNDMLFSKLVAAAQFAAYENSVARQLVTVFDVPMNAGKIVQVPIWGGITANSSVSEGVAPSAADTATNSANITLSEHVVYHQITDMLRDSSYSDVMAQLGDQSGRAIAESLDRQVFTGFNSLTDTPNSGTPIALANVTIDTIMDRVAELRSNKLTGPFYAVLHPKVANRIKKALTGSSSYTASGQFADSILANYFIGQIAGCQLFESALVPVASGNATCAIFAPTALGHAMRGSLEMETQRQAAARATDVVVKAVAGASVLQATHGQYFKVTL